MVKAYDDDRIDKPRGKQRWTGNEHPCWYTGTNGIYKTAWVEYVPHTRIGDLRMDTDYTTGIATVKADVDNPIGGKRVVIAITLNGEPVAEAVTISGAAVMIDLTEKCPLALWNVLDSHLYEITFTLRSGNTVVDTVQSCSSTTPISSATSCGGNLARRIATPKQVVMPSPRNGCWR